LADAAVSPGQLQRPCFGAVGHLPAGNGSACSSGQNQEAHSTLALCDYRVPCAPLHRLRRRFCAAAFTTAPNAARNAARNLHDHSDCYQLQFKRTAGKYAHHVDRQVMGTQYERGALANTARERGHPQLRPPVLGCAALEVGLRIWNDLPARAETAEVLLDG
jgi:hypothetical protein